MELEELMELEERRLSKPAQDGSSPAPLGYALWTFFQRWVSLLGVDGLLPTPEAGGKRCVACSPLSLQRRAWPRGRLSACWQVGEKQ